MHETVDRVVSPFLAAADAALGAGYSALLYGSAARGDYVAGRSDINLLLVLDDPAPTRLRALAPAFAAWRKAASEPPLLISRAEWFRARGLAGKVRGYVPQHWPPGIVPSLVDFDGPAIGPFAGSHDVAGDGMLTLVPTPGHTPGHLAMLLHNGNSNGKPFLLAGDMAHDAAGIADVAPSVSNYCRREGIAVLTAHDPRAAAITEEEDR